jgi:uncharacterized repeat protein (TIGR04052 family)
MAGAAALVGCGGGEKKYTINFAAQVRDQALVCDATYRDIGTAGSTLRLLDFKAYVRDVTLVRANGERHPLALDQDGTWQHDSLALLDFEDGSGTCDTGSPETHTAITGTAPEFDDYNGMEFKLGVPEEINHLDLATAEAPLNFPGMFWSWKGGYRFLRLDVRSASNPLFIFHLGASGCEGTPGDGYTCAADNQASFSFPDFDPDQHRVVFDIAALLAGSDLDRPIDGQTDFVAGCMSTESDPECPPLLTRVGLGTTPASTTGPEAFVRVEEEAR